MNSSYSVSDLGAFSPVDFGIPVVTAITKSEKASSQLSAGSRRRSAAKAGLAKKDKDDGQEEFKVFIQPTLLGRRVDPVSRRIFPTVERLPVETHTITLTTTAVTKELLEKEEKLKEKGAKEKETDAGLLTKSTPISNTTSASTSKPVQRAAKEALGNTAKGGVEKTSRRSGLRNSVPPPSTPVNNGGGSISATAHKKVPQPSKSGETALVRLSSGKIVRVPMDILRQHQAQIKAKGNGQTNGMGEQTRLSQLLSKISPTNSIRTSSSLTSVSTSTAIVAPSPLTSAAPAGIFANGRLPAVPGNLTETSTGQRLIKIRAHQGSQNGYPPTSTPSPSRLSDRLDTIVSSRANSAGSGGVFLGNSVLALNQPSGLAAGQAVRIRTYQGPNTTTQSLALNSSGQRLSSVLGNVVPSTPQGQGQQLERVIVMGPKGQAQKVQLSRKGSLDPSHLKGTPQSVLVTPQQGNRTLTALKAQGLPAGATRAIVVHQMAAGPGGGRPQHGQPVIRTLIRQGNAATTAVVASPPRVAAGVTPQQQQKLVSLMSSPSLSSGTPSPSKHVSVGGVILGPQKLVQHSGSANSTQSSRLMSLSPQKVLVGPGGDIRLVLPSHQAVIQPPQQQPQQQSQQRQPTGVISSAPVTPVASPKRI